MNYYYGDSENRTVGPIPLSELQRLKSVGTIHDRTWIIEEGAVERKTFNSLFGSSGSSDELARPMVRPGQLPVITSEQLPDDVRPRVHPGESIHHFAVIDVKGGCGSTSSAKQWLLVSDQRILFEANVREGDSTIAKDAHQSGSIPMQKVSYVGVATEKTQGCSPTTVTHLRVNSSGGEIILAIPTKVEAARIQGVVDSILARGK